MALFGRIDGIDLVVGDLADLARERASGFNSVSANPERCLVSALESADHFPEPDRTRFRAAAEINWLVAKRRKTQEEKT